MYNPYNYHIAVRSDALFFGREAILGRIIRGLSAPIPGSAAIFGGRRAGKTSLLGKLRRILEGDVHAAGRRCFIPCSLNLQRNRPLKGSDEFFLLVLQELGEVWERQHTLEHGAVVEPLLMIYHNEINRGPVDAFVYAFRSLDTQGERLRLVILIDESENILTVEWGDNLRPNLRYLLSNSPIVEDVALVMAGSTQMYTKVTERDSPLENILDRYCLPALSYEATLALAHDPNDGRLPGTVAEVVWAQSGGQACIVQYLLHELWALFDGDLESATVGDINDIAETFEMRTSHCSSWAQALGETGFALYDFFLQKAGAVNFSVIRRSFRDLSIVELKSGLDALVYHGLVHRHGAGRRETYQIGGTLYRDWFLSAGKLVAGKITSISPQSASHYHIAGDYVAGAKKTGVDQRGQSVQGPQTNIRDVKGPVASGHFESATSFGGEAKDCRKNE
jgi:hypothetical protein